MTDAAVAPSGSSRPTAYVVLGIGGLLTVLVSTSLVGLLRDVTRFGCTYTEEGEGRGWFCGDGIGYLLPGLLVLFVLSMVGVVAMFVIALADRRGAIALSTLAGVPLLIGVWVSFWGLIRAAQAGYDTGRYLDAWVAGVPLAAVAMIGASALVVAGAVVMARSQRTARILLGASVAAALVGVFAQQGFLAPAVASWTLIGVALLRPPLVPRARSTGR